MGYSRKTSNYSKRITLFYPTFMMNMANHVEIGVDTLNIDNECSLEKEFTKLIYMRTLMVLFLTVNQVDSCYGCVYGSLT